MVGDISLIKPDFKNQTIECNFVISSFHWGKGIGTKAIGLAVAYAFQELNIKIVNSACLERNPASSRVLEKNGYVETRNFVYNNINFSNEPARWFQLTKEEWIKRNSEPVADEGSS